LWANAWARLIKVLVNAYFLLCPAYRATLLYFVCITLKCVREVRKYLVEVFARVRVNLQKCTVNFAVMRASLRTIIGELSQY